MRSVEMRDVAKHPDAVAILWRWLGARHREPHVNISHRRMPTPEQHALFVRRHPYAAWWMLRVASEAGIFYDVGEMRAGMDNAVGVFIAPEERRKGYARTFLRMLIDERKPLPPEPGRRSGHWVANINPRNQASAALFGELGFELVQHTYELRRTP